MSFSTPHFHPDAKYLFHSGFLFVRIGNGLSGVAALLSKSIFTRLPEGSDSGSPVILPSPLRIYPNGTRIKNVDFTPFRGRFPALLFPGSSGIRVSSGEMRGDKKRPRGPMSRTVRSYLSLLLRNGKLILLFRGKMGARYQKTY